MALSTTLREHSRRIADALTELRQGSRLEPRRLSDLITTSIQNWDKIHVIFVAEGLRRDGGSSELWLGSSIISNRSSLMSPNCSILIGLIVRESEAGRTRAGSMRSGPSIEDDWTLLLEPIAAVSRQTLE